MKGAIAVYRKLICALLLALLACAEVRAAGIALTAVGQSPDAVMVNVILKKQKIAADYNAMMQETDLTEQKVLIAVVGGSSKGLGAAGIDRNQELTRGIALINAAKAKGLKTLVMHVGGEGRRGELSDAFIAGIVPLADALIIVKGANADGFFDKLKPASIVMVEANGIQTVGGDLAVVLKEWGVAGQAQP
ncbi:MAG: DUF6305 family protein [Synergistaceae bacterium]|nr:DUF6305 family protein [Synergistaceae bacterium]